MPWLARLDAGAIRLLPVRRLLRLALLVRRHLVPAFERRVVALGVTVERTASGGTDRTEMDISKTLRDVFMTVGGCCGDCTLP